MKASCPSYKKLELDSNINQKYIDLKKLIHVLVLLFGPSKEEIRRVEFLIKSVQG